MKVAERTRARRLREGWTVSALGNLIAPEHLWGRGPFWLLDDGSHDKAEVSGHFEFRKNGIPSLYRQNPCTVLRTCEMCGLRSTLKKISERHRPLLFRTIRYAIIDNSPRVLCMGCWNKVRPIDDAIILSRELKYQINQLKRSIANARDQDSR